MKKVKNELKLFMTLILSVAMLVTEIPMTAFATSTEVVNGGEDAVTEQTQTEVIDEEDSGNKNALGNQTGENGEDEAAKEDSGNDDNSNDETVGEETKETEDDGDSEDETTDEAPEDEENNEEVTEEPVESLETSGEISLSSVSDFVIDNGVLTAYNGADEDVEIPEGVVEIGERAFKEKNIKTVEFSSTVVKVANYAFQNCSKLKSVTLNEGLKTIGNNAFNKAALGERNDDTGVITLGTLTIPGTVQSIGSGAFCECTYLGEIEFADGETQVLEIGTYASYEATFGHCSNLSKVKLPARLKVIPEYAFTGDAKLEEVIFGEDIETIDKSAFKGCALTSIELPSTVKAIGDEAFANCSSLKSVTLNEGLKTIGSNAFNKAALGERNDDTGVITLGTLTIPSTVQNIGSGAFCGCTYLGVITFADGETQVLEIGTYASYEATFGHCPNLSKVKLPARLKVIPEYAFTGDAKLEEVIFGEAIETIDKSAFKGCALTSIELPSTVKAIGDEAFANCSSLKSVTLNEGLKTIGSNAFNKAALGERNDDTGVITLGTLTIPGTVQNIGSGAFCGCTYLGVITFADGETQVLEIGTYASYEATFGHCPNLSKVKLPARLKVIPEYAFTGDAKLEEVIFGEDIETIDKSAFKGCALTSIELPSTVKAIGDEAFANCSSLKSVTLNEGLKTIGSNAFNKAAFGDTEAFGTLTIPSTVQNIGSGAFCGCTYLGVITFADGETQVLEIETYASYEATFGHCPELTTVILPERIAKLESYTFYENPKLQTLYIPSKVTEIASNAISNCPKLTIYGVLGSAAETYAKQNNIPFKSKDNLNISLEVQSVKLTPSSIEEAGEDVIGKKIQLRAKVLPDTARNKEVVYESADETIVTVSKAGLVTIKGFGETTITVTTVEGSKTAECKVLILREPIDERLDITEAGKLLFPKKKPEYSAVYTGEQIRPAMTATYQYQDANGRTKTQTLKLNVDYTISYRNNVNAGKEIAEVTIRGIGEYKGTITKTFTITPKDIKGVALSPVGDIVFDENLNDKLDEKPSVVVMDGTHELTRGEDYEVVLSTTGSASVDTQSELTVKGIGNYTGTSKKKVKFNILKTETEIQPISPETVSVAFKKLPAKGYTYNGKAQKPAVVVTDKSTGKKVAASYYKVIYTNNVNAGTATVQVVGVSKKGKGYCGISVPLTFEIKPKDFNKVKVSTKGMIPKVGTIADIQKSVEEALTVKDGKHILSADEYTVDYGDITNTNDIEIGKKYPITLTAKAAKTSETVEPAETVEPEGNYIKDSKKVVYIKFGQLSLASKTANISVRIVDADQNEIILKYNGTRLEKGTDYTAVVTKDKKKDTYTVKIKAVKNSAYKGSRTIKNLHL